MTTIHASVDRSLRAVIVSRRSLFYAGGADPIADRPRHVRAASSLAWIGDRITLVQDDANFLAVIDPYGGDARAITLPRGEGGHRQFDDARGNKKYKFDFEACASIAGADGPLLLAFGSGSKRRRRHIATIDGWDATAPRVRVVDATTLYERLEAEATFAGSDMNIEGALVVGDALRFFGRGNGRARAGLMPVNATCDVSLVALLAYLQAPNDHDPPEPVNVAQYELGTLGGTLLGFTDATTIGEGAIVYAATAESSADAAEDGPVVGSVLGVIPPFGLARYTVLTDETGHPSADKVEGVLRSRTSPHRVYIVIDADDHSRPSELCEVELFGSWG